jgi:mRNA interferase RelE/StbE
VGAGHEGPRLDRVTYAIEVLPAAERDLRKVHPQIRARIRGALLKLAVDPRPPGARALKDRPGYLRVRIGDYRIIYTIEDDVLRVVVVRLGHRRDVYR